MTDFLPVPEPVIDREIEWCAKAARKADGDLWVAAYFAWRVTGLYGVDAIAAIAQASAVSEKTVYNWANAYRMYKTLRESEPRFTFRRLRKSLTVKHFYKAWDEAQKWNLSPRSVLAYLKQMQENKQADERYSADALVMEIEAHENRNGNTPDWQHYQKGMQNQYVKWMAAYDKMPRPVQKWLQAAPDEVKK